MDSTLFFVVSSNQKEILKSLFEDYANIENKLNKFLVSTLIAEYLICLLYNNAPSENKVDNIEDLTLGGKNKELEKLNDRHFENTVELMKKYIEIRNNIIHNCIVQNTDMLSISQKCEEGLSLFEEIVVSIDYFFDYIISIYYEDTFSPINFH